MGQEEKEYYGDALEHNNEEIIRHSDKNDKVEKSYSEQKDHDRPPVSSQDSAVLADNESHE